MLYQWRQHWKIKKKPMTHSFSFRGKLEITTGNWHVTLNVCLVPKLIFLRVVSTWSNRPFYPLVARSTAVDKSLSKRWCSTSKKTRYFCPVLPVNGKSMLSRSINPNERKDTNLRCVSGPWKKTRPICRARCINGHSEHWGEFKE